MIMMGASPDVEGYVGDFAEAFPFAAAAIHGTGENDPPANCNSLVTAFQTPARLADLRANFPDLVDADGNPLNVLKGQYSLVNGPDGLNAVGLPTHLANFSNATDGALVTLQLETTQTATTVGTVPYTDSWHEPSLFSSNTPGVFLNGADAPVTAVIATSGTTADNVSSALARTQVINEWSRRTNAAAGWVTSTDWVITFPTKNFYVDNDITNPFAGRNGLRGNAVTADASPAPFTQMFVNSAVSPTLRNGQSCDQIQFAIRDREEDLSTGAGFSPGSVARLCYEANVLTFEEDDLLNSPAPLNGSINNYPAGYLYGWLNVALPTALPVVGFSIITRDDANALLSEAGLTDHSYVRPAAGG
jgi:hypothetical protein